MDSTNPGEKGLELFGARETHLLLSGMQSGIVTLEDSSAGSYKTNILLPYDLAIKLHIYPVELKTYRHTKTCTLMFTAT